jgi:hypothetical protein
VSVEKVLGANALAFGVVVLGSELLISGNSPKTLNIESETDSKEVR